jgi:hypothetical protein
MIVVYSSMGMLQFGSEMTYRNSVELMVYSTVRFVLALFQVPVHLAVLAPSRFFTDVAIWSTTMLGNGDLRAGVDKYYDSLTKCNWGIATMIAIGFGSLIHSFVATRGHRMFKITEIVSLLVLSIVLASRIYAATTGQTKEWFRFAWPSL